MTTTSSSLLTKKSFKLEQLSFDQEEFQNCLIWFSAKRKKSQDDQHFRVEVYSRNLE